MFKAISNVSFSIAGSLSLVYIIRTEVGSLMDLNTETHQPITDFIIDKPNSRKVVYVNKLINHRFVKAGDVIILKDPTTRGGIVCKRVLATTGQSVTIPNDLPFAFTSRSGHYSPFSYQPFMSLRVPEGHLWVENREGDLSSDSRTYGPVPSGLIVGRVEFDKSEL